jgi:hypothetical protein
MWNSAAKCRGRERRGPAIAAAVVFAAVMLAAPSARADEFSRTSHYSARMFSTGVLVIDARTGDLTIEGWDNPRVEVEAEKVVRAGSEAKARPLYDRLRVELVGQDNFVTLRAVYPARRPWRPFRAESKLSVNFHIKMPYDAGLKLVCVDGDVRISGIVGQELLRVNYGDVEIDVPDVYHLRSLFAHAWVGYVQSDLHGTEGDSSGLQQKVSFYNAFGTQDISVRVRMGGVFIYRGDD